MMFMFIVFAGNLSFGISFLQNVTENAGFVSTVLISGGSPFA